MGANTVLVAYATKHGSTREVAEAIASALQELGATVEFRPAGEVRGSLGHRDLVVLGAPIYSGRWHRDAHRFLKRHVKELTSVPVAVFGMGPRSGTEEGWQCSRSQLERALAKRAWLRPVAVEVFGGVDPQGAEASRDATSGTGTRSGPGPLMLPRGWSWATRRCSQGSADLREPRHLAR